MNVELVEFGPQFLLTAFRWLDHGGLEVHWQTVSQDRFDKYSQGFDVDVGRENLTEVDFKPSESKINYLFNGFFSKAINGFSFIVFFTHFFSNYKMGIFKNKIMPLSRIKIIQNYLISGAYCLCFSATSLSRSFLPAFSDSSS